MSREVFVLLGATLVGVVAITGALFAARRAGLTLGKPVVLRLLIMLGLGSLAVLVAVAAPSNAGAVIAVTVVGAWLIARHLGYPSQPVMDERLLAVLVTGGVLVVVLILVGVLALAGIHE